MVIEDRIESAIDTILILGLTAFALGIGIYVLEKISSLNLGWQLMLATIGVLLLVFGAIGAKIFSRD